MENQSVNSTNAMETLDSTAATLAHIRKVNTNLLEFCVELMHRAAVHDESKLHEPEKSVYDKYTPLLYATKYNSPEYKAYLQEMQVAIRHHEQYNSHHPAHYLGGINGMDLFDIVEMFCDWRAASERTKEGNFADSLMINKDRFGISEQLYRIFANTFNRHIRGGDMPIL